MKVGEGSVTGRVAGSFAEDAFLRCPMEQWSVTQTRHHRKCTCPIQQIIGSCTLVHSLVTLTLKCAASLAALLATMLPFQRQQRQQG